MISTKLYEILSILLCNDYIRISDLKSVFLSSKSLYNQNHNNHNSNNNIEIIKFIYIDYLESFISLFKNLELFSKINNSNNYNNNQSSLLIKEKLYNININNNNILKNLKPFDCLQKLINDKKILDNINSNIKDLLSFVDYNNSKQNKLNVILDQNQVYQSINQQQQIQLQQLYSQNQQVQYNTLVDRFISYAIINNNDTLLLLLIKIILILQSHPLTNSLIKSITALTSSSSTSSSTLLPPNVSSSTTNSLRLSTNHQQQLQQIPTLNTEEISTILHIFNNIYNNNNNTKQIIIVTILPLFIAANQPSSQSLKLIVSSLLSTFYNSNINIKVATTNRTPLFYCTSRETTLSLLQYHAKIDSKDSTGMLPIHYHSLIGNIDVIKCLLDDSTINAQDLSQNTPLHWSSLKGHLSIVKYLISSGAKLNIANSHGRHPIHNAALEGHIEIVKYFIDLYGKASLRSSIRSSNGGASIQIPDRENNTPIDLAILRDHFYCTFELLRYEGVLLSSNEFDFKNGRKIGSGAFADVYLLEWRQKQVAVKKVKYERLLESGKTDEWIKGKFLLEVVLMVKLSHLQSFVKLYGTVIEQNELLLILEFCSYGSLYNLLNTVGNDDVIATLPSINILSQSIANGMAYLHGLTPQIIHRDLTSQNILLDSSGSSKIADFGISRFKNDIGDKTMTAIGNPRWRAPEVTKGEKYSEKVDVFGFGMILYEMFTRRVPFHEYEPVQASFKVVSGERPQIPPTIDTRWAKLIQRCWDHSPANRPSFQEIIQIIQQLPIVNIKPFSSNNVNGSGDINMTSMTEDVTMESSYEGSYEIS